MPNKPINKLKVKPKIDDNDCHCGKTLRINDPKRNIKRVIKKRF
jgi:hypothetical protein